MARQLNEALLEALALPERRPVPRRRPSSLAERAV